MTEAKLIQDVIKIHARRIQLERMGKLDSSEYADLFEAQELMLNTIVSIKENHPVPEHYGM